MTQRKIHFVSLGCPKNRVDSEIMLGYAQKEGFELTPQPDDADVLVVNTCSFIEAARQESVDHILDLSEFRTQFPEKKLVVAGCLAQRYPNELQTELPEVDHFIGTGQIPDFLNILKENAAPRNLADQAPGWLYSHNSPRMQTTPFYTAYVKIAEGCDRTCSFCAIPSFRGKQKSRPIESIVTEVKQLVANGVKEVNLIAQELNGYGRDLPPNRNGKKPSLVDLLQALEEIEPGPRWIRLLYLYPAGFNTPLVEQIANSKRIVPYVDMPLQHISDPVLRAMRRAGKSMDIRKLLDQLRQAIPNITLRTTFLVGFPGETDQDILELHDFLKEQQFDRVGIFTFSKEEGTASYSMTDNIVAQEIAKERRKLLYETQASISEKKLKRFIDQRLEVLIEGVSSESEWLLQGRYAGQAPEIDGTVFVNQGTAEMGEFVTIQVEQAGEHDLVGGIIK